MDYFLLWLLLKAEISECLVFSGLGQLRRKDVMIAAPKQIVDPCYQYELARDNLGNILEQVLVILKLSG
jgi:hypothetical protein